MVRRYKSMLSRNGKNKHNGDFDWSDALIDSAIVAGLAFFSTLGGVSLVGLSEIKSYAVASITACTQFFLWLAIKRGLREKQQA